MLCMLKIDGSIIIEKVVIGNGRVIWAKNGNQFIHHLMLKGEGREREVLKYRGVLPWPTWLLHVRCPFLDLSIHPEPPPVGHLYKPPDPASRFSSLGVFSAKIPSSPCDAPPPANLNDIYTVAVCFSAKDNVPLVVCP